LATAQGQHAHLGITEESVNGAPGKESSKSIGFSKLMSPRWFRHRSSVTGLRSHRNSYFARQQGLKLAFLAQIHPLDSVKSLLKEWCQWAIDTDIRQMQQLAKTLTLHARGILNWWQYRINNGRMEGINNKIKTLLRQTYGLRDEAFLKLKLYGLHDAKLQLLG
jgi:hypothetical protein